MERANEFELPYRGGDSGVKYLMRGPMVDWGVILMHPGERLAPHYHSEVEETFYVLRGRGALVSGGKEHSLIPGDVYRLEAHEDHEITNTGEEDLKLVFIKVPFLPEDKVDL